MRKYLLPLALILLLAKAGYAQTFQTPPGENIVSKRTIKQSVSFNGRSSNISVGLYATSKRLWMATYDWVSGKWDGFTELYHGPYLNNIISFTAEGNLPAIADNNLYWYVLLNNGTVIKGHVTLTGPNNKLTAVPAVDMSVKITGTAGNETFTRIAGNGDLYVYSTLKVWASRDKAQTFTLDTAGLSGAGPRSISFDGVKNPYLGTNRGLYTQPAAGGSWIKDTLYTQTSANVVFVDRQDHVYAFSTRLYRSPAPGSAYAVDTAGIGTLTIRGLEEDLAGNLYVVGSSGGGAGGGTAGNRIYRSVGGTAAFTRIDLPLTAQNLETTVTSIFNEAGGDSVLIVASRYGIFTSADMGDTWVYTNNGPHAEQCYGLARTATNRMVCNTSLGTFYRDAGNSTWNRTYPSGGFLGAQSLYKDKSNNLFTRGAANTSGAWRQVVTSNDNAGTWTTLDTAGISIVSMTRYFVDENGVPHAARAGGGGGGGGGNGVPGVFVKPTGSAWAMDTIGIFPATGVQPSAMGTDRHGFVYLSLSNGAMYRRPVAGGAWTLDSNGLEKAVPTLFDGLSTSMPICAGTAGVYYKAGTTWSSFVTIGSLPITARPTSLVVDDSDYVWVSYQHLDSTTFTNVGDGVWFTKDFGTTWLKAQGSVDTVTFRQLVAIGDSVYGISNNDGIYPMSRFAAVRTAVINFRSRLLNFGKVNMGSLRDTLFSLTNSGTDTLRVTAINSSAAPFSAQTQALSIAPGTGGALPLRFTPAVEGKVSGQMVVLSNSGSSPDTIQVTGEGVSTTVKVAQISFSRKVIDFGAVTVATQKDTVLTVTNSGNDTLRVTGINASSSVFSALAPVFKVAPGANGQVTLRFAPTVVGAVNGSFLFVSNAGTSPDTVFVLGTGRVVTGVNESEAIAAGYALHPVQPNPVSGNATILFANPNNQTVKVEVLDMRGLVVKTLHNAQTQPGEHQMVLDAGQLAAGSYVVRFTAGGYTLSRMMVVVR